MSAVNTKGAVIIGDSTVGTSMTNKGLRAAVTLIV